MISVHQLTKRFGSHSALENVSIEVGRGECLALLGPNGGGKTTLLKCLIGLVRPDSGSVTIGGLDIRAASARAREAVSYLPQQAGFPEHLSVREVIDFYRRLRDLPPQRTDYVIDLLQCAAFADRPVHELSGGMRQRLAIAVVCLPQAPVMLLDEPTASLDPDSAARFRKILRKLIADGTTIVLATHIPADVDTLADRIAVLVEGKLVRTETARCSATLQEIYTRYPDADILSDDGVGYDRGLPVDAAQAR